MPQKTLTQENTDTIHENVYKARMHPISVYQQHYSKVTHLVILSFRTQRFDPNDLKQWLILQMPFYIHVILHNSSSSQAASDIHYSVLFQYVHFSMYITKKSSVMCMTKLKKASIRKYYERFLHPLQQIFDNVT